jgi:hypothetical protein
MTPKQYRNYQKKLVDEAFNAILERERREQHEREMQGWMHQLDQDDQAIQNFLGENDGYE